ncbi:30S ribosomal protein S5 [archaeon]|nr:MAG: 30S ribosomal protein S5 [archaeon]
MHDAGRGDRGRGGERGRGRGGRRPGGEAGEWVPATKLGRLVKAGKINSVEEIFLHSLPVKEAPIIDYFLKDLKDEVMKIMPVQKQSAAGQRTRFKAFIAVGDSNGHVGLGVKCSNEVANAIRSAITLAKLSIMPVRRGYWGGSVGAPHTVPVKLTGHCGSVRVRLIPAPRGTGLVAAPATKRMLTLAGIRDVYTSTRGHSRTMGNFIKAAYFALCKSYGYLTPNLWKETAFLRNPYSEYSELLSKKL